MEEIINFLGKTFGGMIATGAFLFAGVLLVTCMEKAVQGIWETNNREEADEGE